MFDETATLDDDQRRALAATLLLQRKSWEQGVLGQALIDLGLTRAARILARDAVQLQAADGRLASDDDNSVNGAATGEVVLAAGHRDALERQLTWLERDAPRGADGTLHHFVDRPQVWVDTVYMVVPLLAAAGRVDAAAAQLDGHRRRLFDPDAGLYRHIDDDEGAAGRDAHWGSGNGWVVAGIARTLHHLRADTAFWRDAAWHATGVIDACLRYRTPSGLFHDVLDDPATFQEVNLAQQLGYAIFTGLADGWLPPSYQDAGRELLATARAQLDADGLVTPACRAPRFDRPGHSTEAQAFFLLATAAERHHDR